MNKTTLIASVCFASILLSAKEPQRNSVAGEAALSEATEAAMRAVDKERIRAHVRYLSLDLLEGRGTGQRGGDIAGEYIATQFALAGLKPAGDNGTYMQKVPLVAVTTMPESTFSLDPIGRQPMPLRYKEDWVAYDEQLRDKAEIDAPVVWVGYGINAPEFDWDDYKGVDLKGKFLLMLVSEPPSNDEKFFKGRALTYYGRWTYKYEEAARRGAIGVMLIHRTDMASYGWDVVRNSNSGEKSFLRDKGPHVRSAGWIQLEVARKFVAAAGENLDKMFEEAQSRKFYPRELKGRVRATLRSKVRDIQSQNVLALLPGSDPRLKEETVIFSAHYDHLGIRSDQPGDNIYNGADDNATGCAILIEMARSMGRVSTTRPKRSILFAAVTAEEQGLKGSEYLGKNLPVPTAKASLALNFDDIKPLGEPEEIEVSGSERTDFYPVVEETARAFKMEIKPDAFPEAGHYYRSDHFSFARVGIPSFSVNEGTKFAGRTAEWGVEQYKDYTEHHYHQPSDEYKADMDFTADVKIARVGIALGWKAADQPNLVQWKPGDEFEAARKASQK